MPARRTGSLTPRQTKHGVVFDLRFTATINGQAERQNVTLRDMSRDDAERELRGILADVERGTWQPPRPAPVIEVAADPTFHEFATDWFDECSHEWRPTTRAAYRSELVNHLLPFFKDHTLSQITVAQVDRYRQSKVAELARVKAAAADGKPLTYMCEDKRGRRYKRKVTALDAESINKTIMRLAQILEVAVERELLESNKAKAGGSRRKLRAPKPRRTFLDRAEQIVSMLDAAGRVDVRSRPDQRLPRRAMTGTLVFAGLRSTEQLRLDYRDLDLAAGRIRIHTAHGDTKTDASVRYVEMLPVLRDLLIEHKQAAEAAGLDTGPDAIVFPSATGTRLDANRLNKRVLRKVIEEANRQRLIDGQVPLPDRLTPRSMRRTYATLLSVLGKDPAHIQAQMGHEDPHLSQRVYNQAKELTDEVRDELRALVNGAADLAISGDESGAETPRQRQPVAE